MTVYRVGDTWRAEVYLKGRRVADESGFARKRDAEEWHDTTKRALKAGPPPVEATFDQLLDHFRTWHLKTVRPGTKRRYLVDIDQRIAPFFTGYRLADITTGLIEQFKAACARDLAAKSANNCLHTLRLMLNRAVRWKMLAESPYAIESLKRPPRSYRWWDDRADIARFLEVAERTTRYYPAYLLALETGMRYGEIVGLSKADVDFERGVIHVRRQWNEREGGFGPLKDTEPRWVHFDPTSKLGQVLKSTADASRHPEAVFTTATGRRPTKGNLAHKLFKATIRRANVPEIRFHDMRHTFASWYLHTHDNCRAMQAITGMSDETVKIYAHLMKRARQKPLDLASITRISRDTEGEFYGTSENREEKEWRDGRDSNPQSPKTGTYELFVG